MKKFILPLLLISSSVCAIEKDNYYCDGVTTSYLDSGKKREEFNSKSYSFLNNETLFGSEKIKCEINEKLIHCHSDKFNRTLNIDVATGQATDITEILKNGQLRTKVTFSGVCNLY